VSFKKLTIWIVQPLALYFGPYLPENRNLHNHREKYIKSSRKNKALQTVIKFG
jgi:hypothetical protein